MRCGPRWNAAVFKAFARVKGAKGGERYGAR